VLPFANLGGNPEQDCFADGQDLITAPSKCRRFFVIARHFRFTYHGRNVPMPQMGRDLGVRCMLGAASADGAIGCASLRS
jgi:TolB-like protein